MGGAPAFKSVDGGKTFRQHPEPRAQRPSRHLDRSEELQPRDVRQRRRPRRQLRRRRHVGLHRDDGGRPVLRDQRRHAEAVRRVRRPAGQRVVVRAERQALERRHPELRLVPRRRRRRFLHPAGSDRLGDRVLRVAGRRREPPRPAGRHDHVSIRPRPGRAGARRGRTRRPRRWRRRTRSSRQPARRTWCPSRRPARRSASSGTRRPCSRRTTRASCSSAATGCSSR